MPIGAILLRLNVQSPIILKLHAACQVIAYLVYFVAAGMGVWILRQASSRVNLFSDPHPIIGLAILAVALFQPLWGMIHHKKFKRGLAAWQEGRSTRKPGRTGFGRLHLWIGRVLITLAMVNGGLGFRLASESPYPPANSAKIAYAVVAAFMWLLYIIIVSVFEVRKAASNRGSGTREERYALKREEPPAYDESRESL
jgi:cytochrome b561